MRTSVMMKMLRKTAGVASVIALCMIATMPFAAFGDDTVRSGEGIASQTVGGNGGSGESDRDDSVAGNTEEPQDADIHQDIQQDGSDVEFGVSSDVASAPMDEPAVASDASRSQMDVLADANRGVLSDGTYTFASALPGGRLVEVADGSLDTGARVQTWPDNFASCQRWVVSHDAKGYVTLLNARSGKALDVADGSDRPGARVRQWDPNGAVAQKWVAVRSGGGVVLHSAVAADIVLDVPGGRAADGVALQTWTANGLAPQLWYPVNQTEILKNLVAKNKNTLPDGVYAFASKVSGSPFLDLLNGSMSNGANVQIYHDNHSSAQRWRVTHDAEGFVTLTNVTSGKALDVAGGTARNGANVQQFESNGTAGQKWVADASPDGRSFVLISSLNPNLALDVVSGRNADGTNVQVWSVNGATAQKWTTSDSPYVQGAVKSYWRGRSSLLGDPVANERQADGYVMQEFQKGAVYVRGGNTHSVAGSLYAAYRNQNGPEGWLGFPTADGLFDSGNRAVQNFEHGDIVTIAGKVIFVKGDIASAWHTQNGVRGWLGWPKGTESNNGSRLVQSFDGGSLYWFADGSSVPSINAKAADTGSLGDRENNITMRTSQYFVKAYAHGAVFSTSETAESAAFVIDGDIYTYWKKQGGLRGYLGAPKGGIQDVSGGRQQFFAGGGVFWSAAHGAHSVRGAILDRYASFDYTRGKLGFPTSDENRTIKDGLWLSFEGGTIYWRRDLGAHAVAGDFFRQYAADGYELGDRGYPISDEFNDRGHGRQNFEHGSFWTGGMPAGVYSHNVQWFGQPNNYFCAPASGTMMMATSGHWNAANGTRLDVYAMANYMHTALPAGTWENDAVNGLNNWMGAGMFQAHGYPSYQTFRDEVMHSFETGYAPMLFMYERRGGYHPNGHPNASFGHAMVIDSYDTNTDRVLIADPLGSYGYAQKFWDYLGGFRDAYMTWSLDSDAPAIISAR